MFLNAHEWLLTVALSITALLWLSGCSLALGGTGGARIDREDAGSSQDEDPSTPASNEQPPEIAEPERDASAGDASVRDASLRHGDASLGADAGGPIEACDPRDVLAAAMPVSAPESKQPPTGAYEIVIETDPALPNHTLYRPSKLDGQFPLLVWEDAGCTQSGLLFAAFVLELSSHGFVSIVTGDPNGVGADLAATGGNLLAAINYASRENERPCSKLYRHLRVDKVATMGHSCGGSHALVAGKDPRVATVMLWSSGLGTFDKSAFADMHAPLAYILGNFTDPGYRGAMIDLSVIESDVPVFYASNNAGGGTYFDPNGGLFAQVGEAWLRWQLLDDASANAKGQFVGGTCGLCNDQWSVQKLNMP